MGQRFQILIEVDNSLLLYHCQWLWGAYAIRRLGSLVYAIKEKGAKYQYFDALREIDKLVRWAFNHKLLDQNDVHPYFDEPFLSNKELAEEKSIRGMMNSLDNNNGQFYLKIKENKIIGYAFYNPFRYNEAESKRQGKLIDWKTYLEDYKDEKLLEKFNKEQVKEYKRGMKLLKELKLLEEFPKKADFIKKD